MLVLVHSLMSAGGINSCQPYRCLQNTTSQNQLQHNTINQLFVSLTDRRKSCQQYRGAVRVCTKHKMPKPIWPLTYAHDNNQYDKKSTFYYIGSQTLARYPLMYLYTYIHHTYIHSSYSIPVDTIKFQHNSRVARQCACKNVCWARKAVHSAGACCSPMRTQKCV
jgi:hypothetical protein